MLLLDFFCAETCLVDLGEMKMGGRRTKENFRSIEVHGSTACISGGKKVLKAKIGA